MSRSYNIEETSLTNIADAIRNMRQEKGSLTPAQMATKIAQSRLGIPTDVKCRYKASAWVRPEGYPDIEALYQTIGDTESVVYHTYDLTKTPDIGWIGIYTAGDPWYVERGHIENGAFVADWTSSQQASGAYFRKELDSADGNVQLWRVRNASASKKITRYCFIPNTSTTANNYYNNLQPCVERAGKLPYVTSLASTVSTGYSAGCMGTQWLEKDTLNVGKYAKVTTLASMYYNCYRLQEVSCGSWDTSGWAVTTIASMFYGCKSLINLDLSGWDVSKWAITSFASTFYMCYALETLNISTWDVSGWRPTSLSSTWQLCISLKELDLSGWDVSDWALTTIASAWYGCMALKKLDISTWDTTNWVLTTIASAWASCMALEKLDLSGWVTTNWALTTLDSAWSSCHSLRELNLNSWNTTGWVVTRLANTWSSCFSLKTLNISSWKTSNWAVTTLDSMCAQCKSLEYLDLSGWTTTNWAVTAFGSVFNQCVSLREVKLNTWNTTNWAVTSLAYLFNNCYALESIDLTNFNTSNWAVTSVYYMFCNTYGAKTINISNWDVSNFALTEARYLYNATGAETLLLPTGLHGTASNSKYQSNPVELINFTPPSLDIAQNYSGSVRLSKQSLVGIINNLPTIASAKTLTIGQANKLKLTAEEIAVATQKGWTVA